MPRKVLEWIKCLDLAQQALLIIFSQTTTTRLSKELLACIWPDTHSKKQKSNSVLVHELLSSSAAKCELFFFLPVTDCCFPHLLPRLPLFHPQFHHSLHCLAAGGWPSLPFSSPSAPSAPG